MSRAQDTTLRSRPQFGARRRKLSKLIVAAAMALVPCEPALAFGSHLVWPKHGSIRKSATYHAVAILRSHPHHAGATLLRHPRPTKAHFGRHAGPVMVSVHRGIAPLANTAWDNPQIPQAVASAIQTASSAADVDPNLLTALAWRESRFDPNAINRRSSAQGLMQFTTGTWLQEMQNLGAEHQAATYPASDERTRTAILQLRSDPVLSAALAADSIRKHREAMTKHLGRQVTPTDLYLLHVLGPTGSFRFIDAVAQRPKASSQSVASLRTLRNAGLLARDGRPLTVANTYAGVKAMLAEQGQHSAQRLSASVPDHGSMPLPIETSEAP